MPLTDEFPKAVRLIVTPSVLDDDGDTQNVVRGTGFVVAVDSEAYGPEVEYQYLVTAAHVVQGARETFARTRLFGGQLRDEPIMGWVFHHQYDVAVAPYLDKEDIDGASTRVDSFTDDAALGNRSSSLVFFARRTP